MKVVFTREMTGWRFDRAKGDAVVFRPGPQAIKSLLLYGAMAGGLSIVIYAAGGRGQGLYPGRGLSKKEVASQALSPQPGRQDLVGDKPCPAFPRCQVYS